MSIGAKRVYTTSRAMVCIKLFIIVASITVTSLFFHEGCKVARIRPNPSDYYAPKEMTLKMTAYCNCQKCCGWRYNWYGRPVYDGGKADGKAKKVGITANGSRARRGTIAADTSILPFGTIIEIPGYGMGRVEDRGGAIKGNHIDLWHSNHEAALKWGTQTKKVRVWIPKKKK